VVLLPSPVRLVDTRNGTGGYSGTVAPGADRCFAIGGLGGIPSDASGVVVNATSVAQGASGWLTLYPAAQPRPQTSTLNFDSHEYAISNGAIARLGLFGPFGSGGKLCVSAGGAPSFVVLDVAGYLNPTAASSVALLTAPVRAVDTRNGTGGFTGQIAPGKDQCFRLAGVMGIPADAVGVLLNVTAVAYGGNGWLTVFPDGTSLPSTSTVNYDSREYAIANNSVVKLGSSGGVCVDAGASASAVILDVTGYVTAAGVSQVPLIAPVRLVDTRTGLGGPAGPVNPGSDRCFTLDGLAGIPGSAAGVIVNITAVGYTSNGWITVYPAGNPRPPTSTLNFDSHEYAIANGAIVRPGNSGQICIDAGLSSTQVVIDVTGYLPGP
jgi:hypothetical protein